MRLEGEDVNQLGFFWRAAGMKVLSKHLHPDLRRVGEHGVWQTVGLMGEVFRNVILPVVRNAHCDPGLVKFG